LQRALVTGADGFIGSHLVELLVKSGYRVKALAHYNSFNSWGWLEKTSCINEIEVVTGDIRDAEFCLELCKDVDVLFHLAALIGIPYSYRAPQSYIETNIGGTTNLCLAALRQNVRRMIHTSTSEVYGTAQYAPIDEKHPLQPQSPYSASKIAADSMAMSFYNSFDLPLSIARPFNTYGPRQSARAVIPSIIWQIASGSKEIKLGALSPTRDFNYVSDTCEGFLKIANSSKAIGETLNIGSGSEISIGNLLTLIQDLMNSKIPVAEDKKRIRPVKSEVERLLASNEKIKKITDYQPKTDLKAGLEKTIQWFSKPENLSLYKTNIYNV